MQPNFYPLKKLIAAFIKNNFTRLVLKTCLLVLVGMGFSVGEVKAQCPTCNAGTTDLLWLGWGASPTCQNPHGGRIVADNWQRVLAQDWNTLTCVQPVRPFTYRWSTGSTDSIGSNLSAGVVYWVTITDATGCSQTWIFDPITEECDPCNKCGMTLTATSTPPTWGLYELHCINFPATPGVATVSVTGGTPPYRYNWSGGYTPGIFGPQTNTRYFSNYFVVDVEVTDATGCTQILHITQVSNSAYSCIDGPIRGDYYSRCGFCDATVTLHDAALGTLHPASPFPQQNGDAQICHIDQTLIQPTVQCGPGLLRLVDDCGTQYSRIIHEYTCEVRAGNPVSLSCPGNCTTLSASVTGANPAYCNLSSIEWFEGSDLIGSGSSIQVCPPSSRTYKVVATFLKCDGSSYTSTDYVDVTVPTPILATGTVNNPSSPVAQDGSIILAASGVIPSLQYSWSDGSSSPSISGIGIGSYTVFVWDAKGCNLSQTFNLVSVGNVNGSATVTSASCFGSNTGSVTVNAQDGTPPYLYKLDGGSYQSSNIFNNVSAGTHTITVKDATNATYTLYETITQPASISRVVSVTNVSCNGGSTGAINLSVSGGNPGYGFLWSNGQTTQNVSNLLAGTYTVTITDNQGCAVTATGTVTQPPSISATGEVVNASSGGMADGSIVVSTTGGIAPYQYDWADNASGQNRMNLDTGGYTVLVTDHNFCSTTATFNVGVCAGLCIGFNVANISSCVSDSTGSIDVAVSGGTSPYQYSIDGTNFQPSSNFSNLPSGYYIVTVTDSLGNQVTRSVQIIQNAPLTITNVDTSGSCTGGNSGTITIIATGGNFPFTYSLDSINFQTSAIFSGLDTGNYRVFVTDGNGCSASSEAFIPEVASTLSVFTLVRNITCSGQNDGYFIINVNGGTPLYNYSIDGVNFSGSSSFLGLSAGSYIIDVIDANGCSATDAVSIIEPAPISMSFVNYNVSCGGAYDGGIDINASGGTSPLYYSIDNVNFSLTSSFGGIGGGSYPISVIDYNGCSATDSVTISEPPPILTSVSYTDITCAGADDGSINLTVNGGTGGYSYSWNNGAVTQDLTDLGAGFYQITVYDASGCSTTEGVFISEPSPITTSVIATNVTCAGASDGIIDIITNGGSTTPYSYSVNGFVTASPLISGLSGGLYTIIVTDANNCTATDAAFILEPSPITTSVAATNVTCFGAVDGSIDLTVNGGAASFYSYGWNNGEFTEDLTGLSGGYYEVTVMDANGCTATAGAFISEPSAVIANAGPDNTICAGSSVVIGGSPTASGGMGGYSYAWSPSSNLNNAGLANPTVTFASTTVYTVTVTDGNGCTATDSRAVTVISVQLPTVSISVPRGSQSICVGTSVTFTALPGNVNANGTRNFQWKKNGVNVGTNATTYTTNTLVTGDAVTCVMSGNNICPSNYETTSNSITIKVIPCNLYVVGIATNTTCTGTSNGSVNITPSGGTAPYSYVWSNGAPTEDISGLAAGTYRVTVTDNTLATASASFTINSGSVPAATGAIAHPAPVTGLCPAGISSATYSIATVSGATSYTWTSPYGTTITSGHGTNSITVSYGASFTSGYISVKANSACGSSNTSRLLVKAKLSPPGGISGFNFGLCRSVISSATYSIAPVAGATSYTWTAPAGDTIKSGQGTTTVLVSFNPAFISGNLTVTANNACGSSNPSRRMLYSKPAAPRGINMTPSFVCSGQSGVVFSVAAVDRATSYNWTLPVGASITSAPNAASITVNMGVTGGTVSVTASNACGTSDARTRTVSFTCKRDGSEGVEPEAIITEEESASEANMLVYPNPAGSGSSVYLLLNSSSEGENKTTVRIYDALGKLVYMKETSVSNNMPLEINNDFASGMYIVEAVLLRKTFRQKLVIEK